MKNNDTENGLIGENAFNSGAPIGAIVAFAGPIDKIPNNWVPCDGFLYDKNGHHPSAPQLKYRELFNVIGTIWGGDGADKFAVPDLRGLFLRGVSGGSNVDEDAAMREKSRPDLNSSGNGGNAVGSKQEDLIRRHNHKVNPGDNFMYNSGNSNSVEGRGDVSYSPVRITTAEIGGNETRPKNAYVYYIIRIG